MDSRQKRDELAKRFVRYAARILRLSAALPKTEEGLHVRRQILRSGTSPGSQYREACGAESRDDFIHKLRIGLKELYETDYWLSVIEESGMLPDAKLADIQQETSELIAILVQSVMTARRNAGHAKK
jgi:four helix bundle protein